MEREVQRCGSYLVRAIGCDDQMAKQANRGFPRSAFTRPGRLISVMDGTDARNQLGAVVHAPFRK